MDSDSAANAFLRAYLEDVARGERRPLAEYRARFPGHETLVERELAAMESEAGEPPLGEFGPYRLLRELGRGGQGVVWLAEDRRLGRRVALKMLTGFSALDATARARLLREAEVASHVDHPAVCTVYESGEQDGVPFVALRYVEGETLAARIARAGDEPPDVSGIREVAALVEEAARAVHEAHRAGIVHRDLKPSNVVVEPSGRPVVLDFGLAREEDGLTLTRSGDVFGTPAYMAPEQLEPGSRADPRTDVHALGVILYECLTLRRPFDGPTRAALFRAIQARPAPDPRAYNPAVPSDLAVVVATALEKQRFRRYRTALDLAEDLRRFRFREPLRARPVSRVGRMVRWAQREPWQAALIALAGLGLPAAGAFGGFVYAESKSAVLSTGELELRRQELDRRLARGYLELFGGAERSALRSFEAMSADHPRDLEVGTGVVLSAVRLGEPERARPVLRELDRSPSVAAAGTVALLRPLVDSSAAEAAPPVDEAPVLFAAAVAELKLAPIWREREAAAAALDWLQRASLLAPRPRPHVYLVLAQAASLAGDGAVARRAAAALDALWPASEVAQWGKAVALARFEPEQALAVQEELLRSAPRALRPRVLLSRGFTLSRLGRPADAAAALAEAVELREEPLLLVSLGIERRAAGDLEGSVEALRRAVELAPEYDRAHYNLGIGYRALGRDAEAERCYRETLRLRPDHAFAHNNLGNLLRDAGRLEEAERHYRAGLEHDPDNADVWMSLGRHLLAERRTVEAIRCFLHAARARPGSGKDLADLARHLDELGIELSEAELIGAAFRAALDAEPTLASGWNDYGVFCAGRGDLETGAEAFSRAAELAPDEAQYRGNAILALRKLGRVREAVAFLERLQRQRPASAELGLELAELLLLDDTPAELRDLEVVRSLLERAGITVPATETTLAGLRRALARAARQR